MNPKILNCLHCVPFFSFFSCMLAVIKMPQACTDPFQCDRDSDNLNNNVDHDNDNVDQDIIASYLQMFSVNSPYISAESIRAMMPEPESKRNYFTCLSLNIRS